MKLVVLVVMILVIGLVVGQELPENQTEVPGKNGNGQQLECPNGFKDGSDGSCIFNETEEIACPVFNISGSFEPVQAVWQDDYSFEDRPGKQLKKISDNLYSAEIPMVVGKPTVLFGTRHAKKPINDGERNYITIESKTLGKNGVEVGIRFRLIQSVETIIYEEQPFFTYENGRKKKTLMNILGPCTDEPSDFSIRVSSIQGVPSPSNDPYQPFYFEEGPYEIVGEVFRTDTDEVLASVTVSGIAVNTYGPETHLSQFLLETQKIIQRKKLITF